jgi:hypothetical protein
VRLDGKDVEREAALADLLEQAGVALAADDIVIEVARLLLLEDLTDDLPFAVPIGEPFDGGAGGASTYRPSRRASEVFSNTCSRTVSAYW